MSNAADTIRAYTSTNCAGQGIALCIRGVTRGGKGGTPCPEHPITRRRQPQTMSQLLSSMQNIYSQKDLGSFNMGAPNLCPCCNVLAIFGAGRIQSINALLLGEYLHLTACLLPIIISHGCHHLIPSTVHHSLIHRTACISYCFIVLSGLWKV